MNKKYIFLGILLIGLIIAVVVVFSDGSEENSIKIPNAKEVTIIKYEYGKDNILNKISIKDKSDINKVKGFVKELKPLSPQELVDLAIAQEVEIKYGDSITIGIQLGLKDYCYYINHEKNVSELSKMPNGLYKWVEEKLK